MAAAEGLTSLLWTALCAVLAPLLLGAGCLRWLGLSPRHGRRLFAAWAYLVGQFAAAALTALWLWLARPLPGICLPALAAGLGAALLWSARRRPQPPQSPRGDPWLVAVTLLLVLFSLDRSLLWNLQPILTGDEANIWSAKARVLYAADDLAAWLGMQYARHPSYPMFDPLLQVLAFAGSGRVLLWESRLPLQAFAPALLLLLSVAVERRLPRWPGIAALVAFAGSDAFLRWAPTVYADLLVAFALLAAFDAWQRFEAGGPRVWWRLCCIAGAELLASKNEGAMLALCAVLAVLLARALQRGQVAPLQLGWQWLWLLVPLATLLAGQLFDAHHGLRTDLVDPAHSDGRGMLGQILHWLPERLPVVLGSYGQRLLDPATTRWLLLAALLAPLGLRARPTPAQLASWLLLALALCGYVLVFVGTTADLGEPDGPARGLLWHLDTAADRTLLHLLPTAVLAMCLQLERRPTAPAPCRAPAAP